MGLHKIIKLAALSFALGASGASAKDLALIIGNEDYRNFNTAADARSILGAERQFTAAGYDVISLPDATEAQMKAALSEFERSYGKADRVVVVLSGQFLTSGESTWFAPTDLRSPALANVGFDALPLSVVLSFLAEKSGGAALFLGHDMKGSSVEAPIQNGIGDIEVPQGVLVAEGTARDVRNALQHAFLETGLSLKDATAV